MLHIKCFVKRQVSGCPAYALRGFGVASRCQVSGVRKEKLNSKEKYSMRLFHSLVFVLRFIFSET